MNRPRPPLRTILNTETLRLPGTDLEQLPILTAQLHAAVADGVEDVSALVVQLLREWAVAALSFRVLEAGGAGDGAALGWMIVRLLQVLVLALGLVVGEGAAFCRFIVLVLLSLVSFCCSCLVGILLLGGWSVDVAWMTYCGGPVNCLVRGDGYRDCADETRGLCNLVSIASPVTSLRWRAWI